MITEEQYEKLKTFRTKTDLKLKPNSYLRTVCTAPDGTEKPFSLRNYQVQMVLHLLAMQSFVVGDEMGLGKTVSAIAALSCLWEKNPNMRVIVLTTKSSAPQWISELARFTYNVNTFLCVGTAAQRAKVRKQYEEVTGPCVLVMGYRTAVQDYTALQGYYDFVLITDEATAYKNAETQIHQAVRHLAAKASRVWAMTATLIKNNLIEGYGIFKVVNPDIFPTSKNAFMNKYAVVELMPIPGRAGKIAKIKGYLPQHIRSFKEAIDPHYLGRSKHDVAAELPSLITKSVEVQMNEVQRSKYFEALQGLLTVGDSEKEVSKLTSLIYCQQIVNHPKLIDCEGESSKLDALIDMLTEGELEGEKVIIFSRFSKMVDIIMETLKELKIGAVKVTGAENAKQRQEAQKKFQDINSKVKVICITMAGSEAINLQAAKAIVFYDSPWSAGDYLQILGRMIRIGSVHDNVFAVHLIAKGATRTTIDEKVIQTLQAKMNVLEAVLGKRIKGDSSEEMIEASNDLDDLFSSMRSDAMSEGVTFIPADRPIKKSSESKASKKRSQPRIEIEDDSELNLLGE